MPDDPNGGGTALADPPAPPPAAAAPPPPAGDPPAPPNDAPAGDPPADISYDLTLPAGVTDPTLLERTTAIARASGLDPKQAQALVDFAISERTAAVSAEREALIQSYQPGGAEWTKQADAWKTQTMADPKLGKTPEERKAAVTKGLAVIERYKDAHAEDAKAMQGFFDASGLGDHPTVARFFAWLGEAAAEGSLVTGGATGGAGRSTAELMYGPDGGKSKSQVIVTEG
jgi:hypothetical protein